MTLASYASLVQLFPHLTLLSTPMQPQTEGVHLGTSVQKELQCQSNAPSDPTTLILAKLVALYAQKDNIVQALDFLPQLALAMKDISARRGL